MRLAARRFPDTLTRKRTMPGHRNEHGEYVEGAVEETTLRASVQPLLLEDADEVGGVSVSHRLSVYVPEPDALAAAFDEASADEVVVDGVTFTVEQSQSWRGHHTRAILLRQT